MTVRTQEHALFELRRDLLPRSRDAVCGDRELFRASFSVMELECRDAERTTASFATTAEQCHGAELRPAPELNDGDTGRLHIRGVPHAVAVRTHEIALGGLCPKPLA